MGEAYDIVVIGGGHNGLAAAIELAGAGLSTCVVEARDRPGGCAITTEPLLPSFRHSPHANSFIFADILPDGLAPAQLDLAVIQPEAQLGIAFADGRRPVILHRPDLLADTRASLAAYSAADAATYVEMKRRSADLGPVLRNGLYAAPDSAWFDAQRRAVQRAFGRFCGGDQLGRRSARALIDANFATAEIRLLLYALALETGVGLEDAGGDIAFLAFSLWTAGRWRIPAGGMQAYSDALASAARADGITLLVATPVQTILVEHGRATGVVTASGRRIGARLGVIAATPILTLFDQLLPPGHIAPAERAEIEAFRKGVPSSIGVSAFCLDWEPRYASGRHDPQIDRCLKTLIGFAQPNDLLADSADVRAGMLPRPAGVVRVHSLWDRSLAPAGRQIAAIDTGFPAIGSMAPAMRQQLIAAFPPALYDSWRAHLVGDHAPPPMTMSLDDALGFERRMLMRLGDAQYRTSVDGLYMAGPGVYPGGGVHGACGHNAARTVMRDHGNIGRVGRFG